MDNAKKTTVRRPNGRLAACEPCRARKVACDNMRPSCNRCKKRRHAAQCTYPLSASSTASNTVANGISRTSNAARSSTTSDGGSGSLIPSPRRMSRSATRSNGQPPTAARESPHSSVRSIKPVRRHIVSGPGYLGFTSHNAVLQETQLSLSLVGASSGSSTTAAADQQQQGVIRFADLPAPLRETSLAVLRCLPGQCDEQFFFRNDLTVEPKGWSYIAVERIGYYLQETYGHLLSQGEAGLQSLAGIICSNTTQPIRDEHSHPDRWLEQFAGPTTLRWESLGLIWAHLEHASDPIDALRPIRLDWIEGKKSSESARTCLGYCIDLARRLNEGNDLLLDLCRRKATLDSQIDGDARISSYNSHGISSTMLVYLGLHAIEDNSNQTYTPSLCSENKRRIAAQLFHGDKCGSSFSGRPPLIGRRYYSTPLPLDISDEDLSADPETLAQAVRELDENGWNRNNGMYPATVIRVRCLFAFVRDELTEISLSRGSFVTLDHLKSIKDRQASMLSQMPRSIRYHPDDLTDPTVDRQKLYIFIFMQLNYLQNVFFADRLLIRHGLPDNGDLLITSFSLVTLTLKLWTHKDRFSDAAMIRNFEWAVMAYGAPGGGILCQELLHPTFSGTHPRDPSLTRSAIVQQLSLLVAFLDWVGPSDPNGDICADTKAIIQRVLDQHLNAPRQAGDGIGAIDWGFFNQPDFNFELLDTFDWIRNDVA